MHSLHVFIPSQQYWNMLAIFKPAVQKVIAFKNTLNSCWFCKGGWLEGRDPLPLLRKYLEHEINYVIRYQRIHIQWSHWSSQLQGFNRDSQHFGHQTDQCTEYGRQSILSVLPFQLGSALFSDKSWIPILERKITMEMQPKVHSKNSKYWNIFLSVCVCICIQIYIHTHNCKHKIWDILS